MITVHGWLASSNLDTRMTMQVHDELVLEVPEGNVQEVASGVEKLMSGAAELCIPLVVEAGVVTIGMRLIRASFDEQPTFYWILPKVE